MKVREALNAAAARLAGISDTPRLDAEVLMAKALGTDRSQLLLSCADIEAPRDFEELVERRSRSEPVAYIIGRRGFWSIELEVGPGVLIPRGDSETLIEAALAHFVAAAPRSVLDLGTGPGTLLLAALDQWPEARGLGIDSSETALDYARRNAERLGLARRARFELADWGGSLGETFDLVLCNPPYVAADADLAPDVRLFEPAAALFAGGDGLDDYRRLAPQLGRLLAPGGIACIEIGAGQAAAVRSLFSSSGLKLGSRSDLAGHVRCLTLQH